jgi:predicted AAA+ superfamily ATPase
MTMAPTKRHANTPEFIPRALDLSSMVRRKSYFLFGPRQTGKSFLIRHQLQGIRVYNLLDTATFLALSQNPGRLAQELAPRDKIVVIDEVQRLPILLNEVHLLMEERGIHFLLTGSSARKLRRGGVNLLGGRARTMYMHPLTTCELGDHFDLSRVLHRGLLPSIYFSDDPDADLAAYAGTYLREEIIAEGATRNIPAFSRFLKVAALSSGTMVNFTNIASDAQVPRTTVHEYFEILRDTLFLHEIPAWRKSLKRKPIRTSKYYFFDVGVVGHLQGRRPVPRTREFGEAFETLIMHELVSWRDYRSGDAVCYWRSASGYEVDFILGDHTAIEVKAKENVSADDMRSLRAIAEEKKLKRYLCVSLEPRPRRVDGVTVLPYREFLTSLWSGQYR